MRILHDDFMVYESGRVSCGLKYPIISIAQTSRPTRLKKHILYFPIATFAKYVESYALGQWWNV